VRELPEKRYIHEYDKGKIVRKTSYIVDDETLELEKLSEKKDKTLKK